jgi:hypothetical protein
MVLILSGFLLNLYWLFPLSKLKIVFMVVIRVKSASQKQTQGDVSLDDAFKN